MTFQRNNWCQMAKPVERSGSKIARAVNCGYNDYVWEVDILIGRYGRSVCARGGGCCRRWRMEHKMLTADKGTEQVQ